VRRLHVVGIVLVAAVVIVGVGFGLGSDDPAGDDIESVPTASDGGAATDGGVASDDGSGDERTRIDTTTAGETTPTEPKFAFLIDRIEECGDTCRDVTSTLENGGAAASDVTVYTRIYAGNGTDGDVVWQGTEPVGDLGGGESYTATKRVDLSFRGALAIRGENGWITVQTTVESDERTVTFTQRRNVL
jgi:hypothetical protein